MKSKQAALVGLMVVCVGVFTFVLTHSPSPDGVGVNSAAAKCVEETEKCLPQITMVDVEGTPWTPPELEGKVVLINFWATWCKPCIAEVPLITEYYEKYKDQGFVVLGLMTDQVTDVALTRFSSTHGLNYPVVRVDDRELYRAWGNPNGLPTTFIYDRGGTLQKMHVGPLRPQMLESLLPRLIEEQP